MRLKRRFPFREKHILLKHWTTAVLFSALLAFPPLAKAALTCQQVFLPQSSTPISQAQSGVAFLHERDPKLHTSALVEKYAQKEKRQSGSSLQKPADKITVWLNALEAVSQKAGQSEWALQNIKDIFYRQYVIKPGDVPEGYYQLQVRLARERGQGDITLSEEQREQLAATSIEDQEKSLDSWIEFMVSPDTKEYPMWAKFWMFTGVTKLSKFNPEQNAFGNRAKDTVAPFPELNREAASLVMDMILRRLDKKSLEEIKDPKFLQLLQSANFGKLYAHALTSLGASPGKFPTNEGRWVRYPQGSDPTPLVESLQGKNTGWCTAGAATAQIQLQSGDFYVYYSLDNNGQPTQPRIAIRMQGNDIGEIRGVAPNQNMDEQIAGTKVLSNKLQEFGDKGLSYQKKVNDMRILTEIERKTKVGLPLSKQELISLYEIDNKMSGFGHGIDPRIAEIRAQRDIKADFSLLFSGPDRIKEIHGSLNLSYLTSADGLILPEVIDGSLDLSNAISAEGLKLPKVIAGSLELSNLTSAKDLKLPETIGGDLNLRHLISAEGINFPETIGKDLFLNGLTSAKGLELPKAIGGDLILNGLTSAEGLKLPKTIAGGLSLSSLTSAEGLELPENVRDLWLGGLTSAEGLHLPETVRGTLFLNSLTSVEGLHLSKILGRYLYLDHLETKENIVMPKNLEGKIFAPFFRGKFEYR
jgi:hypothetical protein